ncbi:MAG: SDR family oxidoreductase [Proteobacteria bacterium]|jgi:3-oxoacyl-[acyl-carrier protein] reductase|nr:SDR family oxidoreductase [Pseudomonadota bacterium]MDA0960618.1 SDR family oxidoreductase [Pseudomonadota bacterium]MDA1151668.1 SDR family oxidoreductase [Pseudomonadota bacterium]
MAHYRKTALVTGSGQNIGRGIAHELAKAGHNIVVNGSRNRKAAETVAAEVRELGVNASVAMGNVGVRDEAELVIKSAVDTFGSIDILVNNAAIRPHGPFLEIENDDWQNVIDVNMYGPIWLARAALPFMLENGWGRIIHFTGMNAQRGYPGAGFVSVSKHALWGLTKALAVEFGPSGITSNIISPGTFPSDNENIEASEKYQLLLKNNPSGRLGKPDDIGGMIAYLCSENGGFVNGQMLQINGGVVMQY